MLLHQSIIGCINDTNLTQFNRKGIVIRIT